MEITKAKKQSHRHVLIFIIAVLLLAAVIVCLFLSGYLGLWVNGLSSVAGNLNRYYYLQNSIEEECSFTINLKNLESNTGKVVYQNEDCYIDIQNIDLLSNGQYQIHFRSHGIYNIHGATLISGVVHYTNPNHSSSYSVEADLCCYINENYYLCEIAGVSAINWKDGDSFGYYIPVEAITEESQTLTMTLSNLTKNIWYEK